MQNIRSPLQSDVEEQLPNVGGFGFVFFFTLANASSLICPPNNTDTELDSSSSSLSN
jgi:hypothetical protein